MRYSPDGKGRYARVAQAAREFLHDQKLPAQFQYLLGWPAPDIRIVRRAPSACTFRRHISHFRTLEHSIYVGDLRDDLPKNVKRWANERLRLQSGLNFGIARNPGAIPPEPNPGFDTVGMGLCFIMRGRTITAGIVQGISAGEG